MIFPADPEEQSKAFYEYCLPHISIDSVIFGFSGAALKVLLTKLNGHDEWGLPGGYLLKTENLDQAAYRILEQRTGVSRIFLEQFKTFGEIGRSEAALSYMPEHFWHRQRFVCVGYYALVNYQNISIRVDEISEACEWKDVTAMPELMMDHQLIFETALGNLRQQLNYKPIGLNLLPEEFTMPELQKLYEAILGKCVHRGSFQRKMLGYNILIRHDRSRNIGAHKAPILYSFDIPKYHEALRRGLREEW